jgi:Ni,Fe-hydrogenase III small subunit/ferredoxin
MTNKIKGIMSNSSETIRNLDNSFIADNYRGGIVFNTGAVNDQMELAKSACPTKALTSIKGDGKDLLVDHGKCIMCGYCSEIAPKLIKMKSNPANPTKAKSGLVEQLVPQIQSSELYEQIGIDLKNKIHKMFGRSLTIRQIDAGSCNGCEIEITTLNNPIYDIERFGIHFVASPRHADVLLVTGPASRNMETALKRAFEATPNPKIVIAVGACACSGGIFGDTYATTGGIDKIIPVDVYIPGCPPRPQSLISGLFLAIDKKIKSY